MTSAPQLWLSRASAGSAAGAGGSEAANAPVHGRLMARAGGALALANLRYWSTVAPLVVEQLDRWERRAEGIGDPALRALALSKLGEERFNVQVAATLATCAKPPHRRDAVVAIVALQVMYDYLDLLSERALPDPPGEDRRLLGALVDALTPGDRFEWDYGRRPRDGDYLRELVSTVGRALAKLPTAEAVGEVARRGAARCAQAQFLSHAAAHSGIGEAQRWATCEAAGTDLQWQELLAGGAASVLAVHALIAAAADPRTTRRDAEAIDAVYLSIGALTMLDSLVDRERDLATGELNYLELYDSRQQMAERLASVVRVAMRQAPAAPNAAHHVMTLAGVVAYYASAPAAHSALAASVTSRARDELRPLITPTLAIMRAWRLAKSLRRRRRRTAPGLAGT